MVELDLISLIRPINSFKTDQACEITAHFNGKQLSVAVTTECELELGKHT